MGGRTLAKIPKPNSALLLHLLLRFNLTIFIIAKLALILHHDLMNGALGFQEMVLMMMLLLAAGGPIGALKMLMLFAIFGFQAM